MAKLLLGKNQSTIVVLGALAIASVCLGSPAEAKTYNVRTYGATGDGLTDDSFAISLAISAARLSPGNTVYFPAGNYVLGDARDVSELVSVPMTLLGSNATLEMSGSQQNLFVTGDQVVVDSLAIANTGSDQDSAVIFKGTHGCSIKNCSFTGWTNAIMADGSTGVTVDNDTMYMPKNETGVLVHNNSTVTVTNSNFHAVTPSFGYGVISEAADNTIAIKKCLFDSLGYSVYAFGGSQGSIKSSHNSHDHCYYGYRCASITTLTVDADTINNSTYGIYGLNVANLQAANCTINSPSSYGVYVDNSQSLENPIELSNNAITNLSGAVGILVEGSASVTNNTVSGSQLQVDSGATGIYAYNTGAVRAPVKVAGNTIKRVYYAVESASTNSLTVENNHISDCQSCGIYTSSDLIDSIRGNDLRNCGLTAGNAYAVIYVNGFSSGNVSYIVTNNTYNAQSTPNLTYFVYVHGANVTVKGNQTNTMLPSSP